MRAFRNTLPALLAAMLMAGCVSRPPGGLSREEWNALAPLQQAKLKAKYGEVVTARCVAAPSIGVHNGIPASR